MCCVVVLFLDLYYLIWKCRISSWFFNIFCQYWSMAYMKTDKNSEKSTSSDLSCKLHTKYLNRHNFWNIFCGCRRVVPTINYPSVQSLCLYHLLYLLAPLRYTFSNVHEHSHLSMCSFFSLHHARQILSFSIMNAKIQRQERQMLLLWGMITTTTTTTNDRTEY